MVTFSLNLAMLDVVFPPISVKNYSTHQNRWGETCYIMVGTKIFFQWSCRCSKVHWIQCKRKGAPKSGGKCHWIQWKKMWFTENGDKACTEFGDEKGNSPNSVMNSSLAGIVHIWVNFFRTVKMVKMWHFFIFLELCCDQTVWVFHFSQLLWRNFDRGILRMFSFSSGSRWATTKRKHF